MDKRATILYVDDEDINLFIFEKSFGRSYNVITARSGEEALSLLGKHADISVAISDLRMPGMDGLTFVRKAKDLFKGIRYFVLTAFNHNEEIDNALSNHIIDSFFTKPFDVSLISAEIDRATNQMNRDNPSANGH